MTWRDQRWGLLFTDNVSPTILPKLTFSCAVLIVTLSYSPWPLFFVCILACFIRGSLRWEQKEEEFAVYEPYCANYTNASELMLMEEQNLVVCLVPAPVCIRSPGRLEAVAVNAGWISDQTCVNRNIIT